jgi:GntR family transcriptional regulator of vanillate catabolism
MQSWASKVTATASHGGGPNCPPGPELTPRLVPTRLPVLRNSRLMEAIRGQLRDLIIAGTLPPGSVLLQQELAERLGVSRTPLREALISLEQEGLVESSSSGKTRVTELSDADARESMQAREVVDGIVARLLAQRGLPVPLRAKLEQHLTTLERTIAARREPAFRSDQTQLHLALMGELQNRWVDPFTTLVRISSQATRGRLRAHPLYQAQAAREHRSILEAITAGNADQAEEAARMHVRAALQHWDQPDGG